MALPSSPVAMGTESSNAQVPLHKLQNMKLLIRLPFISAPHVAFTWGITLRC